LKALPFSMICAIISHGSLRSDNDDGFRDFTSEGTRANRKYLRSGIRQIGVLNVMSDFFPIISHSFYELNASMWASLRARLVLFHGTLNEFPSSLTIGTAENWRDQEVEVSLPDGVLAHLTRECGGTGHMAVLREGDL
jgi:hypothetical protein